MVVSESFEDQGSASRPNGSLKELNNSSSDRYYNVRPYQHLGVEKFQSYKIKRLYCYIKVLKKMFGVHSLNMYMFKKVLMKPDIRSLNVLPLGRYNESSGCLSHHFVLAFPCIGCSTAFCPCRT